ncbi:MAG TPA: polyphenol oxidase family protein [Chthoniobacterales bacterium]|jgi:polyphenol oxidase|nr:polyphenol oxidase family protein [Chthoniobacterales bacterium]
MIDLDPPVERFPALDELEDVQHGLVLRVPGLDVRANREMALQRLEEYHQLARQSFGTRHFCLAEQVHGNSAAAVTADSAPKSPRVDALITRDPQVLLGIYVADCCAVFLVDSQRSAIGLVHSGKKGTELNIVGTVIQKMAMEYGTEPADLVAQLSPCIRPPFYEVDFAANIVQSLKRSGVRQVFDSGENTAADLERYYSYRMEKGRTGRMLALLGIGQHRSSVGLLA